MSVCVGVMVLVLGSGGRQWHSLGSEAVCPMQAAPVRIRSSPGKRLKHSVHLVAAMRPPAPPHDAAVVNRDKNMGGAPAVGCEHSAEASSA